DMLARLPVHGFPSETNWQRAVYCSDHSIGEGFIGYYRALILRHATATRLALRLFEIDHGAIPPTLAALVPDYLPALPVALFRADRGTFIYMPERRYFYSVGQDGIDNHGGLSAGGPARISTLPDWSAQDVSFFLEASDAR